MIFQTALLGALALIPSIASATPLGSKHTAFLATCAPTECPIGLCDPDDFNKVGAAYFVNGPPSGNTASASAFTSTNAKRWEGVSRSVNWSRYGTFKTSIDANAANLPKGEIAGSATLTSTGVAASEPFVCFKDGSTKFRTTIDLDSYTCTATYYCPSVNAGTM